jgi:shikimate dehydrogenase
MINSKTKICTIIGDPVSSSLSPVMHNAGYKALGIESKFIYVATRVSKSNLGAAIAGLKSLNFVGASCTTPHKEAVMEYLDEIDEFASTCKSVNTVVFSEEGRAKGYNTDGIGVVNALIEYSNNHLGNSKDNILKKKSLKIGILGNGGAAKAVAYACTLNLQATITIFARDTAKASQMAKELGCLCIDLQALDEIQLQDIIINATPVGMGNTDTNSLDITPIKAEAIRPSQIVFDMVYYPLRTPLIKLAQRQGAHVVFGTEMLLHQGVLQFELFTNLKAPIEVMRKALLGHI